MPDYGNSRSSTRRGWWDRVWSKIDSVLSGLEASGLRFDEGEWLDKPKGTIPASWISEAKSKARGAADALGVTWKNNDFTTYRKARSFASDLKRGYDEWRAGHEAGQSQEETQGEETPLPQHTLRIQAPGASSVSVKIAAGNKWVGAAQSPMSGDFVVLLPPAYGHKVIVKAIWPGGLSALYPPTGSVNVTGPTTLQVSPPQVAPTTQDKIRPNLNAAAVLYAQDTQTPMASVTVSAPDSTRLSVRRVVTGGLEVLAETPDTAEDTTQASVPMGSVLEARASWVDGSSTVQVIPVDGDKVIVLAQEALPVEVIVAEVEAEVGEVPAVPAVRKWYRRPSTWLLLGAGGLAVAFGRRALVGGRRDALAEGMDYDCGCGG